MSESLYKVQTNSVFQKVFFFFSSLNCKGRSLNCKELLTINVNLLSLIQLKVEAMICSKNMKLKLEHY